MEERNWIHMLTNAVGKFDYENPEKLPLLTKEVLKTLWDLDDNDPLRKLYSEASACIVEPDAYNYTEKYDEDVVEFYHNMGESMESPQVLTNIIGEEWTTVIEHVIEDGY